MSKLSMRAGSWAFVVAGIVGCSAGAPSDFDSEKPARADTPVSEFAPIVALAPSLRAELAARGAARVRLHLREPPAAVAELTGGEVGFAVLEHGVLVDGAINGVPMDRQGFIDAAKAFGAKLDRYNEQARQQRAARWAALGEHLGLKAQVAPAANDGRAWTDAELTADDVAILATQAGDSIDAVELVADAGEPGSVSMASALSAIRVQDVAFPAGWKGDGVGVFVTDAGGISTNADCINAASNRLRIYGTNTPANHPTEVVCALQQTAPEAKILYQDSAANAGSVLPSPPDSVPIYVSSQSVSYDGGTQANNYRSADRDFDNRTMTTRIAHFQLANNQHGNVRSPGIAYNVMTVGAYDSATNTMPDFSNWIDPDTGAYKPEIVAPGVSIDISPTYTNISGTSTATPMAAGFAADLMEQFTWLRLRPQVLASYLIVNGVRINTDGGTAGARDGYGRVDYNVAQSGLSYWWDGTNSQFFDASANIDVTVNLGTTGNYLVALSWLVDGDYVLSNTTPNQDLDLYVYDPTGAFVASSTSVAQTHEVIKFNATRTGNYLFRIHRYRNSNVLANNVIGLVVRRR
jgi:hypothetical protein